MGALSGSLSYTRYSVSGTLPDDYADRFERAMEARRFLPLSNEGDDMETAGWVCLSAPYDNERPITREDFLFEGRLAFAFREDKIVLPAKVVQSLVAQRLEELEQEATEPLPKTMKKTVELAVRGELRHRALPRSTVIDVVWDVEKAEMRIFGRGKIVAERLAALFERTFDMRIEPLDFAARAFRTDMSERARHKLETLGPKAVFDDLLGFVEEDEGL